MQHYLLATLIVLGTALVVTLYNSIANNDENPKKTFATTVLAGAIVSTGVLYFGFGSKPKVSTEPFVMDAPSPPQIPPASSVPMPTA